MRYLTDEEVLAIHWAVVQDFGGAHGVLNRERLKSCVETPSQTMFGDELYPDLASKAGILFFLLIKNHCFVDGNKRTAVLSMLELLERNGFTLQVTNDELYQFALDVATSGLVKERVIEWVRERIRPYGKMDQ